VIGIANGVVRELAYKDRVGDLAAHQISTSIAVALFAAYFVALNRRWPLPSRRTALQVGVLWVFLTIRRRGWIRVAVPAGLDRRRPVRHQLAAHREAHPRVTWTSCLRQA
jgi:hypothetical protein